MEAQAIAARIQSAYGACSSYRNKGVVSWSSRSGHPREVNFETYFVRPDCFRFDWIRRHPYPALAEVRHQFSIFRKGESARFRWERDSTAGGRIVDDKQMASLEMAVAAGVGTSGEAAVWIHQLLFPESCQPRAILLNRVSELLPHTQPFGPLDCYVLRGNADPLGNIEFWADTAQFAVRKSLIRNGSLTREINITESVFDEAIEAARFDN